MFILTLTYVAPLEEVDRHVPAHMDWIKAGYASGTFLASGRKVPRTGGFVLAKGERAEIEALVATDPFMLAGVTRYDIAEVAVAFTAPGLEQLKV
ncbi:MAG TPA: YciI family protein [Devosia sp.]|nr:YciI family protein [Devosia sp.]